MKNAEVLFGADNRLLALLPANDRAKLQPNLKVVELISGQFLYENIESISYIYFPINCIVSLRCDLDGDISAEFAQIGNEGLVGISALMGSGRSTSTALVRISGTAYKIRAEIFRSEFDLSAALRGNVLVYIDFIIQEAAQWVVCNRYHSIYQQLSRILLMTSDRTGGHQIRFTHEQMALTLGCRREAISIAAKKLQALGAIRYKRGAIEIADRLALAKQACECYKTMKDAYVKAFNVTADGAIDGSRS